MFSIYGGRKSPSIPLLQRGKCPAQISAKANAGTWLTKNMSEAAFIPRDAVQLDLQRTAFLESIEISVVRFNNMDVLNNMTEMLEMIHCFISDRKSPHMSYATSEAWP